MVRARPEIAIERDSRIGFLRGLRELDLQVEPPSPYDQFGIDNERTPPKTGRSREHRQGR